MAGATAGRTLGVMAIGQASPMRQASAQAGRRDSQAAGANATAAPGRSAL